MITHPKSVRNEKGQFVKTGYDDKLWKSEWHQRNKERRNKEANAYYYKNKSILMPKQLAYAKRPEVIARRRQTTLMTSKGTIRGLNKRPYSETCEMCGQKKPRMNYHHWNDDKPSMGIWLCGPCHWFVEGVETGLQLKTYLDLKQKIESEHGS